MARRHRTPGGREAGQTSVEYLGLILLVVAVIAAIAATGIASAISDRIACAITHGDCDRAAPSQNADARPAAAPQPDESKAPPAGENAPPIATTVSATADPAPSTLVGEREGVGGYPSTGGAQVQAAFVKKLGCKIPGIKQICKWTIDRLEDEVVKACAKSLKACSQLIEKACKVGRKVCDIARELACFTLGILCRAKGAAKKASARIVAKFAARRQRIIDDLETRSIPATRPGARGRLVKSKSPKAEAHRIYRDLKRGPDIKVIKDEPDLKVFTTPSGTEIRLRSPVRSRSNEWTIDVIYSKRNQKHYKFYR